MGVDDIDEDEPVKVVVGPPAGVKANPSLLDDLFGPTTASTVPVAKNASAAAAPAIAKNDPLDDFFGGTPCAGRAPAAAARGTDVFDALFSGGPSPAAAAVASASPAAPRGGFARTAMDQLDAFSAVMSGTAVPWRSTASVASSQPTDISGAGAGSRVFVPPDSVLALMTLYDVLGAAPGWSPDDIAKSYKKKALMLHPDKLPGGRTAAEDRYFKIVTAAYDVLKDSAQRAEYDAALGGGRGGSSGSWLHFVA